METKTLKASSIARRVLYDLVIPLAIGFVLVAAGMYFVLQSAPLVQGVTTVASSGQQIEIATNHQIFKDVLQTTLAVAALGLAAFGVGAYRLLSTLIEAKVSRNTEIQYHMTIAYHKSSLGYVYWRLYEKAEPKSPTAELYLDIAIEQTRMAYDEHVSSMHQNNPKVEPLICGIRNNLAYYISEKHHKFGPISPKEQAECMSLAN